MTGIQLTSRSMTDNSSCSNRHGINLSEEEFARLQPRRARGLEKLEKRINGITREISEALIRSEKVRVLEIGFGFGTALVELWQIFGSRVELHGINKCEAHGNWELLLANAKEKGLIPENETVPQDQFNLHYLDITNGLPFEDDFIDVIFCQVAFFLFNDKLFFLREANRVLKSNGIAKIDIKICSDQAPPQHERLIEIWRFDQEVEFWRYIESIPHLSRNLAACGKYLEMRKTNDFACDLELVTTIPLHCIFKDWVGVKSIYGQRPNGLAQQPLSFPERTMPSRRQNYSVLGEIARVDATSHVGA